MSSKLSRRNFLKLSGMAAAVAASQSLPLFSIGQESTTLNIGINALWDSLDAHATGGPSNAGNRIFGLMFDGLMQADFNGQPKSHLATSWENDGSRWIFTLREGVVFHDGTVMTADDVVASFTRMIDPTLEGSFGSGRLAPFLESVEKIDDLTVAFNSIGVDPLLPLRVSYNQAAVMPQAFLESADADTLRTNPIGAGPYKVVEYTPEMIALEVHSEYWGGRPAADEVILRLIPENATRVGALQSGEIDLITNLPIDQVAVLEGDEDFVVSSTPLFNYMSVLFNTVQGPTADVRIRQALSLAIDRELMVNELFGGRLNVMTDYLLPGTFGFDESLPNLPYDPDRAMELLAEAGYAGEPIAFTPIANYYVNSELYTTVINEMWRAVGVETNYEPQELGTYVQTVQGGALSVGIQSWGSAGDALFSLYISWAQPGFFRPGLYNPPAEFDEIYTRLTTSIVPDEERYEGIRQITNMFFQDVPTAPLFQSGDFFASRQGINYNPHPEFYIDLRPDNFSL